MGQFTKKWPFSIAMLNYQRVCSFKILPFGKWFITPVKFPKGTTSRGGDSIRLAAGVRGRNSPWRRAMGRTCSAHNVCTLCTVYTAFFLLKQTHTHIYIIKNIYIYIYNIHIINITEAYPTMCAPLSKIPIKHVRSWSPTLLHGPGIWEDTSWIGGTAAWHCQDDHVSVRSIRSWLYSLVPWG